MTTTTIGNLNSTSNFTDLRKTC